MWTWLLDPADPGHYFGIPVDNALAWLASCTGFGYAAMWLPGRLGKDPAKLGTAGRALLVAQISLLGLVLAALFFAVLDVLITPPYSTEVYRVPALFGLVLGAMAWLLVRAVRGGVAGPSTPAFRAASLVMVLHLAYVFAALLFGYDEPALYPLALLVAAGLAAFGGALPNARGRARRPAPTPD